MTGGSCSSKIVQTSDWRHEWDPSYKTSFRNFIIFSISKFQTVLFTNLEESIQKMYQVLRTTHILGWDQPPPLLSHAHLLLAVKKIGVHHGQLLRTPLFKLTNCALWWSPLTACHHFTFDTNLSLIEDSFDKNKCNPSFFGETVALHIRLFVRL